MGRGVQGVPVERWYVHVALFDARHKGLDEVDGTVECEVVDLKCAESKHGNCLIAMELGVETAVVGDCVDSLANTPTGVDCSQENGLREMKS